MVNSTANPDKFESSLAGLAELFSRQITNSSHNFGFLQRWKPCWFNSLIFWTLASLAYVHWFKVFITSILSFFTFPLLPFKKISTVAVSLHFYFIYGFLKWFYLFQNGVFFLYFGWNFALIFFIAIICKMNNWNRVRLGWFYLKPFVCQPWIRSNIFRIVEEFRCHLHFRLLIFCLFLSDLWSRNSCAIIQDFQWIFWMKKQMVWSFTIDFILFFSYFSVMEM